ncbi:MAG: FkbM family methyltransferase, partial [Ferruginibacter sp.]
NFQMLRKNLDHYENVTCLKKGIWNKTANLEIIDFSSGEAGFRVGEFQQISEKTIQAITVRDLMEEFQLNEIDILKVDIEGSEEQVFLEEPEWLKKVNIIFCEIHEIMKPGLTIKIKSLLTPYFNYFINGEYYVFVKK